MPDLRWGADAPESPDAARERIVDAAQACFDRFGVLKTTVEDVATAAQVSRATVYRYFAGRDAIVVGVLGRELERAFHRLSRRVLRHASTPAVAIVEGVLTAVDEMRTNPKLRVFLADDTTLFAASLVGASEELRARADAYLVPVIQAGQQAGVVRAHLDPNEAAEWLFRVIVSLLTLDPPAPRGKAAQRRFLRDFVVPAFVADDVLARDH